MWGRDPFMAFATAADQVLGPPDHTVTLTSEQYGEAIADYLTKHKLLPPGRYHQSHSSVQEGPGRASLVVYAWRSDDPVETTAESPAPGLPKQLPERC
jgi:hypothetical protein